MCSCVFVCFFVEEQRRTRKNKTRKLSSLVFLSTDMIVDCFLRVCFWTEFSSLSVGIVLKRSCFTVETDSA